MEPKETALNLLAKLSGTPRAELTPDKQLVGDLGINSLKTVELLLDLEQALDLEISDEEAAEMATVGDVLAFLEKRTGA